MAGFRLALARKAMAKRAMKARAIKVHALKAARAMRAVKASGRRMVLAKRVAAFHRAAAVTARFR